MTAVLRAETPVYGGYVIARGGEGESSELAGGVVFIKGAVPGEVVEVSLREKRRDYSIASVTGVVEPSSFRVAPPCRYFGACGGCQIQYVSYGRQVSMKEEILRDCLSRIGKIETGLLPAIVGRDFNYRHRGQFKVSRDGRIGFYREASRDVIDIEECPLMISGVNEALGRARAAGVLESKSAGAHEVIKELHITQGAQGGDLTALVRGRGFDGALAEHFAAIGFTGVAFEDESYRGCGYVSLDLSGLKYTVSPWSFFQSNWGLNNEVVGVLLEGLRPLEGKRALDMYAGAGNFSLPISREAAEVVAVEDNPHAVKDGQRNLSLNGIKNVKPIKAHIEKAKLAGKFDVAVLDPPRPGLTAEAMRTVLDIAPERIAYVSCNPSTLARDIGKMRDKYDLASVRLIDLFPNTYHIEAIALLDRKGA